MNIEEAVKLAHDMYAYEISEQADANTGDFDDLWQSLYDVAQLGSYGIVDLEEEEVKETVDWLKKYQTLTKKYLDTEIYF